MSFLHCYHVFVIRLAGLGGNGVAFTKALHGCEASASVIDLDIISLQRNDYRYKTIAVVMLVICSHELEIGLRK